MARILVGPSAQADIDSALGWYSERASELVQRLLAELDVVFERISKNPEQFPIVADPVRRALLRKFPYSVYFIVSGDLAEIVAVVHQSRQPTDWASRGRAR